MLWPVTKSEFFNKMDPKRSFGSGRTATALGGHYPGMTNSNFSLPRHFQDIVDINAEIADELGVP